MRAFRLPPSVESKWSRLMAALAGATGAHAARVAFTGGGELEILAVGGADDAAYRVGERLPLAGSGGYCESVAASGQRLAVHDPDGDLTWRLLNPRWADNPDAARGMSSYLGLPVRLPHGPAFGTVCLLGREPVPFEPPAENLLEIFRDILEDDLAGLCAEAMTRAGLEASAQGVLSVDLVLRVRVANRRFRDLWRLADAQAEAGDFRALLKAMARACREPPDLEQHMLGLMTQPDAEDVLRVLLRDGRTLECRSLAALDDGGNAWGRVWLTADATDYRVAGRALRELADTDTVTGLSTRARFMEIGRQEVVRAKRYNKVLSLVLLDLDGLDRAAARHGARAVDDLLADMAGRGRTVVRNLDLFARLDTARLALLLPETDRAGAEAMAARLAGLVAEAGIGPDGIPSGVRAVTGVACFSRGLTTLESLVSLAASALDTARGMPHDAS